MALFHRFVVSCCVGRDDTHLHERLVVGMFPVTRLQRRWSTWRGQDRWSRRGRSRRRCVQTISMLLYRHRVATRCTASSTLPSRSRGTKEKATSATSLVSRLNTTFGASACSVALQGHDATWRFVGLGHSPGRKVFGFVWLALRLMTAGSRRRERPFGRAFMPRRGYGYHRPGSRRRRFSLQSSVTTILESLAIDDG